MCFNKSPVGGLQRWNWDGDAVVFDTTVPSHRSVIGTKRSYTIDVRNYVRWEKNAVISNTLREKIRPFAGKLTKRGDALFDARQAGSFDFRVHAIESWVGQNVAYSRKEGVDPWQFPDETLTIARGDCEDLAFLMAALMLCSGVSGYHVRVALGEVRVGEDLKYDHAWVMYKAENGEWRLVEPLRALSTASPSKRKVSLNPAPVRYVPSFLFNDEHLWVVERRGNPGAIEKLARRRWNRMSPKFAGEVHLSILQRALFDAPVDFRSKIRDRFTRFGAVGPLIDADDWINALNPSATPYDPRQHFDNALISESWDLLENNAAKFRADRTNANAFGKAAHAISDFYAHSSYLAFALLDRAGAGAKATIFHPDTWNKRGDVNDIDYGPGSALGTGIFDLHKFSKNRGLWKMTDGQAIKTWNGKIISGRYAQSSNDRRGGTFSKLAEARCSLPAKYQRPELGAVPHHSEIAVDDPDWTPDHRLFTAVSYALQYNWRINTAVAHVRKLWLSGKP